VRLKYNAPSPNHRRVISNPDPNRVDEDPEEFVWENSNNFIVELPDALARQILDQYPGEFEEASSEEQETREETIRGPKGTGEGQQWVEKLDTDEGDDMPEPPGETSRVS